MDEKSLVCAVSASINSFSFDEEKFVQFMNREHRTLQQSFTRLCVAWLRNCGSDDYQYDGRNEASHDIGKAVSAAVENKSIPLI